MLRPLLLLLTYLASVTAVAEGTLGVPKAVGVVNDFANIIDVSKERSIAQKIQSFERETGHEIGVLTVDRLPAGRSIESFAIEVARAWGVGKAERDNGVLLVIAQIDRQMRIEVGYGLEGQLTDVSAHRIIRRVLIPAFRKDAFAQGIDNGVEAIIGVLRGEPSATQPPAPSEWTIFVFIFGVCLAVFILPIFYSYLLNEGDLRRAKAEDQKNDPALFKERLEANYYQRYFHGTGAYDGSPKGPNYYTDGESGFTSGGFGGGSFGGGGFGGGGASGGW